jgi:DNA-binding winged helix-turn-helix (wHTH) protein
MPRLAFGIFDFDPETNALRRNEIPVKLQTQPARVLAALLANPGEVITRERLHEAVWKGETFVDFERGLNFCVAQVRSALGDSAESPCYVRTLPKKGYQFIAPVRTVGEIAVPLQIRRFKRLLIAALAVALLAAGVFTYRSVAPRPAIKVAIARFDNQTG